MDYDLRRLSLTTLLVLDAVCRHKNTIRAAEELAMTQPAVSTHIARLKDITGEELFVRTKSGLEPSAVCLELWKKALEIFALSEGFFEVSNKSFDPEKDAHEFRISIPVHKTRYYFETLTLAIKKRYPLQKINLVFLQQVKGLEELQNDMIDLYMGFMPDKVPERLRYEFVQRLDFCVMCSDQSPFFKKKKITKDEFVKTPHIKIDVGVYNSAIDRELRKLDLYQETLISVPDQESARNLILNSEYLNITEINVAKVRCKENKRFTILKTDFDLPSIDLTQFWDRRNDTDPAHIWLRNYITSLDPELLVKKAS